MGWYTGQIHHSAKEELRRIVEDSHLFPGEPSTGKREPRYRLLDVAIVSMREAYMAVLDTQDGKIRAEVYLVSIRKIPRRSGLEFGYKPMDETWMPCAVQCPARILARLSPLDECYAPGSTNLQGATEWRQYCRANLTRAENLKALKEGTQIKLETPMKFRDGAYRDTFRVKFFGKKRRFVGDDGAVCQIRNPKDLRFTVLAA